MIETGRTPSYDEKRSEAFEKTADVIEFDFVKERRNIDELRKEQEDDHEVDKL